MKLYYNRGAAAAMIFGAGFMRLSWGLAVEFPSALNASWICPLLGFLICFPLMLSIHQSKRIGLQSLSEGNERTLPIPLLRLSQGIFALLLLYDAVNIVRLTASSSNIIALGDVTVHLLIVPLASVIGMAVICGPEAVGNSARVILHVLPAFILILLAVQIKNYRFNWLFPLLGSGPGSILSGGIYAAGILAILALVWLPAAPDENAHSLIFYLFFCSAASSILLLCFQMGSPAMPKGDFTQAARVELMLSNGRMSLSPQFLLNILWYGGQLLLIATETTSAAVYLKNFIPSLKPIVLAVLETTAVCCAAILNPGWMQHNARVVMLALPVISALFALNMIFAFIRRKGYQHA